MKNIYLRPLIETDITDTYLENFKDNDVLLFLEVTDTESTFNLTLYKGIMCHIEISSLV